MAIEIEKKFVLDEKSFEVLPKRIASAGATFAGTRLEKNILYSNDSLDANGAFLRVRVVGDEVVLTYKRRLAMDDGLKSQLEFETGVADFGELTSIIENLGLREIIVYEKKRQIWNLGEAEVVLDELPFGLYMEIEGSPDAIRAAEVSIGTDGIPVEKSSYPELTIQLGEKKGEGSYSEFR